VAAASTAAVARGERDEERGSARLTLAVDVVIRTVLLLVGRRVLGVMLRMSRTRNVTCITVFMCVYGGNKERAGSRARLS
jgi:hypothetical protein